MDSPIVTKEMHNRICARYEFQQGRPVAEAFQNFCKTLGDYAMEYKDFQFWYQRFQNGQMELNLDRRVEMPVSSGPIELEVHDAPKNIFVSRGPEKRVVIPSKRALLYSPGERKMLGAKKGRPSVEKPIVYSEIKIDGTFLDKTFNETYFKYRPKGDDKITVIEQGKKRPKVISMEQLIDIAKNPKTQIKQFTIGILKNRTYKLEYAISQMGHQLHVESFGFQSFFDTEGDMDSEPSELQDGAMEFLPYLKPGVLENITLTCGYESWGFPDMDMDQIVKLDQWKQAKRFTTNFPITIGIEDMSHFDYLNVMVHFEGSMETDDVIRLKEIYMNSPTFEYCHLDGSFNHEEILEKLGGVDNFQTPEGKTLQVKIERTHVSFKKE